MDKFETPHYLRERADGLRKLALEHVGQYAQSLRKFAEELDAKAARIESPESDADRR
jgi:hypothetical protein